jgi:hypothetical protein
MRKFSEGCSKNAKNICLEVLQEKTRREKFSLKCVHLCVILRVAFLEGYLTLHTRQDFWQGAFHKTGGSARRMIGAAVKPEGGTLCPRLL